MSILAICGIILGVALLASISLSVVSDRQEKYSAVVDNALFVAVLIAVLFIVVTFVVAASGYVNYITAT